MRKDVKYALLALMIGVLGLSIPIISGTQVSRTSILEYNPNFESYSIIEVKASENKVIHLTEEVAFEPRKIEKVKKSKKKTETTIIPSADPPKYPDLIATSNQSYNSNYKPNEQITFETGIRNDGDSNSKPFNVKWFLDGKQIGYGSHNGIAAKTTDNNGNSIATIKTTPGQHNLTFLVDADNFVAELNENNNQISFFFSVENYPADLVPLTIVPQSTEGEKMVFKTGIANTGGLDSGQFNVKWFLNGNLIGYGSHSAMTAGSKEENTFEITATSGQHNLTFIVDADNHVQEWNESNNQAEYLITID